MVRPSLEGVAPMLSEDQKNVLRAKVEADNDRLQDALAPYYLGRICPIDKKECVGMKCFAFQLMEGSTPGKIGAGACALPVIAAQIGPIANSLMSFANAVSSKSADVPRVIGTI